jgi:hypothetical protein
MEWRPGPPESRSTTCVVPLHQIVVAAVCKPQHDVRLGVDRMHRRRRTRGAGPYGEGARLAGQPAVTPTCLHIRAAITA